MNETEKSPSKPEPETDFSGLLDEYTDDALFGDFGPLDEFASPYPDEMGSDWWERLLDFGTHEPREVGGEA